MSTFASPPRSLPRKRTPNFGEREYSARFIAAEPSPCYRPTMGAAGTMLSDRRMERSVGNEDGPSKIMAAHTVAGVVCIQMKHGYRSRRPHVKIRLVVARVARHQQEGGRPTPSICPERQYLPIYVRWRGDTPSYASRYSPGLSAKRPCH